MVYGCGLRFNLDITTAITLQDTGEIVSLSG